MKAKGKSRLGRGTIIVLIALLAMVLVIVLSSTAFAGGTQGKFNASTWSKGDLAKLGAALHVSSTSTGRTSSATST